MDERTKPKPEVVVTFPSATGKIEFSNRKVPVPASGELEFGQDSGADWTFVSINELPPKVFDWEITPGGKGIKVSNRHHPDGTDYDYSVTIKRNGCRHTSDDCDVHTPPPMIMNRR
jgi:hypothetical protein